MNHCIVFVGDDCYEILYDLVNGIRSIVRYRGGRNVHGEEVDYDNLPLNVQHALYQRFKRELQRIKDLEDELRD